MVDLTHTFPQSSLRGRQRARLASVAFVAIVGGLVLWEQRPPEALPADAPADAFSAARAMRHVEAIARQPHPLGSPASERVRAYVMDELRALGLEPAIQQPAEAQTGSQPNEEPSRRDVRNIVARRRGTGPENKKALLLSAHHDSVRWGPGAGDDASGVAAILESLRAVNAGPPLERDLLVLINDGEEEGLYGAAVFADQHRWAQDVGVVINVEARGNSGPCYMFETSDRNGWLIEQLAHALPHPVASSVSVVVSRLMPNDSDLTVYRSRGMAGLNFAFIGGLSYYHTADDTPANLDPRSLQHQGESVLAMTRRLAQLDLEEIRRPDLVYFSLLKRVVLRYPMTWVIPLLACAGIAYVTVIVLGMSRRRVRLTAVFAGFAAFPVAALAAVLVAGVLKLVISDICVGLGLGAVCTRFDIVLLTFFALLAVPAAYAVFRRVTRRWSCEGVGLGVLAWCLALTGVTSRLLPGASFVFVWPLLGILAGQAISFLTPRDSSVALAAAWLGAVPLLLIDLALFPGLFNALNVRMAALLMLPVVLFASALLPLASQVTTHARSRSD
jgi:Peptidase family M28